MQLWREINAVTLHKIVKTMPQQMRSKAVQRNITVCSFFFGQAVYILMFTKTSYNVVVAHSHIMINK